MDEEHIQGSQQVNIKIIHRFRIQLTYFHSLNLHVSDPSCKGFFKGKHIGEFAGLAATNKEVNVPLCVSYYLENGLIKHARIYMLGDVLMQHLNT